MVGEGRVLHTAEVEIITARVRARFFPYMRAEEDLHQAQILSIGFHRVGVEWELGGFLFLFLYIYI